MGSGLSGEDIADDVAVDIGETAVDACGAEGEFFVIDAHEVEDGGVEVVAPCDAFGGFAAEFVAAAVGGAGFDACAGEPCDEASAVVIAAGAALGEGRAAEFGGPYDEGVVEETALGEVFEESGDGAVDADGDGWEFGLDVAVIVPVVGGSLGTAPDLDDAGAAFDETACEETAAAEVFGFLAVHAVAGAGGVGFAGEVEGFGCGELHACGEFVAGDAGVESGVAGAG